MVQLIEQVEVDGGLVPPSYESWAISPLRARGLWLKHSLDTVLAAIALLAATPLFLALAIAVKVSSPGPVFFRQQRIGRGGRPFVMLKFRSMRQATTLARFEPADDLAPGGLEGEDRRTRLGRWLRDSSLDELPQLINVIRQEMSIVGPRPERPHFVERFCREVPSYRLRLRVRPGITGLAQVRGLRGRTSLTKRVEADNEYIDTWSPWRDLIVVLLTARTVFGFLVAPGSSEQVPIELQLVGHRQGARPAPGVDAADPEPNGDTFGSIAECGDGSAAMSQG